MPTHGGKEPFPESHGHRPCVGSPLGGGAAAAGEAPRTVGCHAEVGHCAESAKALPQDRPAALIVVARHQRLAHQLRVGHDAVSPAGRRRGGGAQPWLLVRRTGAAGGTACAWAPHGPRTVLASPAPPHLKKLRYWACCSASPFLARLLRVICGGHPQKGAVGARDQPARARARTARPPACVLVQACSRAGQPAGPAVRGWGSSQAAAVARSWGRPGRAACSGGAHRTALARASLVQQHDPEAVGGCFHPS